MTFAEKLKTARKQAGMSQEKLAEKLGVSRQAVTKWETDMGTPDIENIMSISELFGMSLDDLLSDEKAVKRSADFLYESITEYDIDETKRYDLKLGGAKTLHLFGGDAEKIRVRLASNTLATLQSDFKVKIDDIKKRIDVDVSRRNGATEATAKKDVVMFIQLPNAYLGKVELAVNAESIEIHALQCDRMELTAKTHTLTLDGVVGALEVDCNLDMDIICRTLQGAVELNQVSATSKIHVPKNTPFAVSVKGIATSLSYEKGGKPVQAFDTPDADNMIELNGIKSELVICTLDQEVQ